MSLRTQEMRSGARSAGTASPSPSAEWRIWSHEGIRTGRSPNSCTCRTGRSVRTSTASFRNSVCGHESNSPASSSSDPFLRLDKRVRPQLSDAWSSVAWRRSRVGLRTRVWCAAWSAGELSSKGGCRAWAIGRPAPGWPRPRAWAGRCATCPTAGSRRSSRARRNRLTRSWRGASTARRLHTSAVSASSRSSRVVRPCSASPDRARVRRSSAPVADRDTRCGHPAHAVLTAAAFVRPSSPMAISRMRNFWILPVTVIGNSSTNFT